MRFFLSAILFFIYFLAINFVFFSEERSRIEIVRELFSTIEVWLGVPYQLGGNDKNGVDCSAFVKDVYQRVFKTDIPRTVREQKNIGKKIIRDFQPGDLLFFNTTGDISHVGIYVFDKKFIHAASAGSRIGVIKSSLDEKYYKERFVFARRVITLPSFFEKKDNNNPNYIIGNYFFTGKVCMMGNKLLTTNIIFIQQKNDFFDRVEIYNIYNKEISVISSFSNGVVKFNLKKGRYTINFIKNNIISEKTTILVD